MHVSREVMTDLDGVGLEGLRSVGGGCCNGEGDFLKGVFYFMEMLFVKIVLR